MRRSAGRETAIFSTETRASAPSPAPAPPASANPACATLHNRVFLLDTGPFQSSRPCVTNKDQNLVQDDVRPTLGTAPPMMCLPGTQALEHFQPDWKCSSPLFASRFTRPVNASVSSQARSALENHW